MGDGEAIIHLKNPRDTHVNLWVPQDHLDGLNHLLHFVEALQKHGGQGRVPGSFELVMHYRMLRDAVRKAEATYEESQRPDCDICGEKCVDEPLIEMVMHTRVTWCGGEDCRAKIVAATAKDSPDDEQRLSPGDLISKCNVRPASDCSRVKCDICDKIIYGQRYSVQLQPTSDWTVWCGAIDCTEAVADLWNKRSES